MDIEKTVFDIVQPYCIGTPVTRESLLNDIGLDSLDTLEMVMEVEKHFNLSIPDEDVEEFKNVGQIVDYIGEKIKQ